ncbi:MAG: hypothetical protein N3G80_04630 [Candidatus Micrarchaeota archaeon]|nr:hypothetical protein [Candidatus Micrarchaeota archaeon]
MQTQAIANATAFAGKKARLEFFKLHEALTSSGFGPVNVPLQKGLMIYDRSFTKEGQPTGKSSYSVFVWVGKNTIKIRYQNPSISPEAAALSPFEISNLHIEKVLNSKDIERIVASISQNAAQKPEYVYFLALHDHIRYVNGEDLVRLNIDDGMSDWITMILHKKLENIDFDFGSSCHNHFPYKQMVQIKQLEERMGIEKGASVELTMPFSKRSTNGPHHLLWFADFEVAKEYHEKFLERRIYKYPAYAPDASPKKLKKAHEQLREERLLAVGIAHPSSGLRLPMVGVPPVGILDLVGYGAYPFDWAIEYVAKYADSVACFNALAGNSNVTFANPSEEKKMVEIVRKWGVGKTLRPNTINLAFAYEMQSRFGTAMHADNDVHNFHTVKFKHTVHGYGKLRTALNAAALFGEKEPKTKPSIRDVIGAFRQKDGRLAISVFVPYSQEEEDLVKARKNETVVQILEEEIGKLGFHLRHTIPAIWQAIKVQIDSLFH